MWNHARSHGGIWGLNFLTELLAKQVNDITQDSILSKGTYIFTLKHWKSSPLRNSDYAVHKPSARIFELLVSEQHSLPGRLQNDEASVSWPLP